MAEERTSEHADMTIETYKTERQREKKPGRKKKNSVFKKCGAMTKGVIYL